MIQSWVMRSRIRRDRTSTGEIVTMPDDDRSAVRHSEVAPPSCHAMDYARLVE
jgi:hypothetical protein